MPLKVAVLRPDLALHSGPLGRLVAMLRDQADDPGNLRRCDHQKWGQTWGFYHRNHEQIGNHEKNGDFARGNARFGGFSSQQIGIEPSNNWEVRNQNQRLLRFEFEGASMGPNVEGAFTMKKWYKMETQILNDYSYSL